MKKTNVTHLFVLVMLILALIGGNAIVHMSITNDEGEIGITVGGGTETTAEDVESTEGENVGTEAPVETDGETEPVEAPNETEATETPAETVAPTPIETTEKNVETKPVEPETTVAVPETEDPTVDTTEVPTEDTTECTTEADTVVEESKEEVKEEEVK